MGMDSNQLIAVQRDQAGGTRTEEISGRVWKEDHFRDDPPRYQDGLAQCISNVGPATMVNVISM